MSIHLYSACWNEERIIPFFLRHYEPLVDRIVVYDDHSTDRSVELLRASPKVEIRPSVRDSESFLEWQMNLFEICWKESRGRADWVCLADLDEFLFHPSWHQYLSKQENVGITVLRAIGYDMITEEFPCAETALATSLTRGQRQFHMDKTAIFSPDAVEQINNIVGRHHASPVGRIAPPAENQVQLRHYKALGLDYLLARMHTLAERLTNHDRARGWSTHYLRDDDAIRAQFQKQLADAATVPSPPVMKAKKDLEKKLLWRRRSSEQSRHRA